MDLFRVHLENTRALDRAFDIVSRECKDAIRRQDVDAVDALTKTCGFLLGARMENRLLRLLFEDGAFDSAARARILDSTIEESWLAVIDEAFAARRGLRVSAVPGGLNFTDKARHAELVRIVKQELAPLITFRNVLAHGQWHRGLTSDRSSISSERTKTLNTIKLWHLMMKANLLEHLVKILHDLAVTRFAFERDFDKHWDDLNAASRRLALDRSQSWEEMLVRKYMGRPKLVSVPVPDTHAETSSIQIRHALKGIIAKIRNRFLQ